METRMKIRRCAARLLAILMVLAAVAGCDGGVRPVALSEVPLPPDARPYEGAKEAMADSVAVLVRRAVAPRSKEVDGLLRSVPKGTRWEQIRGFYAGKLEGAGWKPVDDASLDAAIKLAVWKRGRQTLAILFLPHPGDVGILMVELYSS